MKTISKNLQIGFTEKKIIIISVSTVVIMVLVLLFFSNFISPEIDRLSVSLDSLRVAERILGLKRKNLDELESNKARLSAMDSEKYVHRIPTASQTPDALVFLSRKMAEKNITETGFSIDPANEYFVEGLSEGESVISQTVTVTGIGGYNNAIEYLDAVINAGYFYKPLSFNITSRDILKRNSVQVTIRLNLFILNERGNSVKPEARPEARENVEKNPFYYTE